MKILDVIILAGFLSIFLACAKSVDGGENGFDIKEKGNRIFLIDRTNQKWDITHAVEKYGFDPDRFQYGLGPDAIKPINQPQFISPGDANYPNENDDFLVLAAALYGDTKAYPISVMSRHEITNDAFGFNFVAVAY